MNDEPLRIRKATLQDEPAFFDICLKTAASGSDGAALYSDPHLPGLVWATPYLHTDLAVAFVVVGGDEVLGYAVGAPDTEAFEAWQRAVWWPKVAARLHAFKPQTAEDRKVLEMVRKPPDRVPSFVVDYPAHLHINLLPRARQGGWGRGLIETLCESVRQREAEAIHLGVGKANANAIGFYRHLGFADVAVDGDGLILGMRL